MSSHPLTPAELRLRLVGIGLTSSDMAVEYLGMLRAREFTDDRYVGRVPHGWDAVIAEREAVLWEVAQRTAAELVESGADSVVVAGAPWERLGYALGATMARARTGRGVALLPDAKSSPLNL